MEENRIKYTNVDHELSFQVFEKPTQIYKYISHRHLFNPLFLTRTLSYMKINRPKLKQPKKKLKIDSLLNIVENKLHGKKICDEQYLIINYFGYYDDKIKNKDEFVKILTSIIETDHVKKENKNACSRSMVFYDISYAPVNPTCMYLPTNANVLSIPVKPFINMNENESKSYHLFLKIMTETLNLDSEKKVSSSSSSKKKRKSSVKEVIGEKNKEFGASLLIYDKRKSNLLKNGFYDCIVEEINTNRIPCVNKSASWTYFNETKTSSGFSEFESHNKIKFYLKWSSKCFSSTSKNLVNNKENRPIYNSRKNTNVHSSMDNSSNKFKILYQFLHNNSYQQTEAGENLCCPWCTLYCFTLYALLKHLQLCHARFTFCYFPLGSGARIDVGINEHYNGCDISGIQDLIIQLQKDKSNKFKYHTTRTRCPEVCPVQSNIIVYHSKQVRRLPLLQLLYELECSDHNDNQTLYVITGLNRQYYHTSTYLPKYPQELYVDSEDERNLSWFKKNMIMKIDDLTSVSNGEKEIMKMWNLYVMKERLISDCQIPLVLSNFIESKGRDILRKNLYRYFVLHLCKLCDLRLISPVTFYITVKKLQDNTAMYSKTNE